VRGTLGWGPLGSGGSTTGSDAFSSARWFKWHGKILGICRPLRSPPVSQHGFTSSLVVLAMRGLVIDDLPGPRHDPVEELDLAALAS
jgi:hypothetical protein